MKNKFKLIPLVLCLFAGSAALADEPAPVCPPANDYVQAYNLPINLPMHTLYSSKYKGDFSETVKIKLDSGWLLTIKNIVPNPNTPIKIIGDIFKAIEVAENDAITSLQNSQKIASQAIDKWEGKTTNIWQCEYSTKNHYALASAILPRG